MRTWGERGKREDERDLATKEKGKTKPWWKVRVKVRIRWRDGNEG
jgi:hypothetical protein